MLDPNNLDFKQLGFHAGIEVHHHLNSERKLFCHCKPILEDDPENMEYSFYRYFRPVLGEMGDFDEGMLVEFEKGYKVIYYANERNTCSYEMDETPPFNPDMNTIRNGFILAYYFNCTAFAEEVVVNRKQYLDGSITTGFQRTFIIARDGWVPVNGKKVRISNFHIEEDAARRVNWVDTSNRTVYFNLDRLGFPLTEVITEHEDVESPAELIETALQIGRVELSKIGRRGIGAARQDINISITGGDRVELKGVQDVGMFDLHCRLETVRQHSLLQIKDQMAQRGVKKEDFEHTYIDVTHLFELKDNKKAYATVFPKIGGLFGVEIQPNKDLGLDIFEKSMLITGIPREDHFHSDEIEENAVRKRSAYPSTVPIDKKKHDKIQKLLNAGENDAFVVVLGSDKSSLHALKKIVERAKYAVDGVPQETRRVTPDGNSEFLRVIHGKDRIYPDTDTPPILIPLENLEKWKQQVGKRPWEVFEELNTKHKFSQNQVDLLIRSEKLDEFYHLTDNIKLKGSLVYRLLIEKPREKRRKGIVLDEKLYSDIAESLAKDEIIPEDIDRVIDALATDPTMSIESIRKFAVPPISNDEIDNLIKEELNKYPISELKSDEMSLGILIPKIVGVIMDSTKRALRGQIIVDKIHSFIEEVN